MNRMISVIVPVYKVEKYLNRCVSSIVRQTYKNLEIILVDDGSPDKCGHMCDQWAIKDRRIVVIHKKNGGLSDARNAGIEMVSGSYIGFVDSDDWIEPDMYANLIESIETSQADVAVTGIDRCYENGFSVHQFTAEKVRLIRNKNIVESYLKQNVFSTAAWDKLYKKELFSSRRFPVGKLYEDAPIIFDILCNISAIICLGKPQYHYYQRYDSICGQPFSLRKMDHYVFSKQIRERVYKEYPELKKEADIFYGTKICEILYTLYESENKKDFNAERELLYSELMTVWRYVLFNDCLSSTVKIKNTMALFHLIPLYNEIKSLIVKRS